MNYFSLSPQQLSEEKAAVQAEYQSKKDLDLRLDMSRGKPSPLQSDLSEALLKLPVDNASCFSEEGIDCRNYGFPKGLLELRRIFAPILGVSTDQIVACGNSTLNLMYDCISDAMLFGYPESEKPWGRCETVKFLCPCPGYDRHFGITEAMGIELIRVDMLPDGPDMDTVERLVKNDPSVKGIWCVPKYSNPDGYVYSEQTVRRLASMECAAADFKIFWDNAYCIHDLYDESAPLTNLLEECEKAGNPDRALMFFSTSKITHAGSGIAFFAGSEGTVTHFLSRCSVRTIGYDKMNQLRHALFFKTTDGVRDHMKRHAALLRPKFEIVCDTLRRVLLPTGTASWNEPKGGYFVSLNVLEGTATRTYQLAAEAGVTLTKVGATFPYGKDPKDSNIRISPSAVSEEELKTAIEILCICAKLAALEKLEKNSDC